MPDASHPFWTKPVECHEESTSFEKGGIPVTVEWNGACRPNERETADTSNSIIRGDFSIFLLDLMMQRRTGVCDQLHTPFEEAELRRIQDNSLEGWLISNRQDLTRFLTTGTLAITNLKEFTTKQIKEN